MSSVSPTNSKPNYEEIFNSLEKNDPENLKKLMKDPKVREVVTSFFENIQNLVMTTNVSSKDGEFLKKYDIALGIVKNSIVNLKALSTMTVTSDTDAEIQKSALRALGFAEAAQSVDLSHDVDRIINDADIFEMGPVQPPKTPPQAKSDSGA